MGQYPARNMTTGHNNLLMGNYTGRDLIGGYRNVFLGRSAGRTNTSGNNNMALGFEATSSSATVSNEITLGNSSISALRCQVTSITALSDERDKANITPLTAGLGFINKLNPVSFNWDIRDHYFTEDDDGVRTATTPDGTKEQAATVMGFISQEVIAAKSTETEAALNDLILDSNPDKYELKQGDLLVPAIKAIQELSAKVDSLLLEINALKEAV